jgi:hypothetical protein
MADIIISEVINRRNGGESVNIVAGSLNVTPGASDLLIKFQISAATNPTVTGVLWSTYLTPSDLSPSFDLYYSNGLPGMPAKLRYANNSGMTGAVTLSQTTNASPATFTITPDLTVGTWYVQGQVNDDGTWYPQNPVQFTLTAGNTPQIPTYVALQYPVIGNVPKFDIAVNEANFVEGTDGLEATIALDEAFTSAVQNSTVTPSLSDWVAGTLGLSFTPLSTAEAYMLYYRVRTTRPGGNPSAWVSGSLLVDNLPAIKMTLTTLTTDMRPSFTVMRADGVTDAKAVAGQIITLKINTVSGVEKTLSATILAGDITGGGTNFFTAVTFPPGDPVLTSGAKTTSATRSNGVYSVGPSFNLTTGVGYLGEFTTTNTIYEGAGVHTYAITASNPNADRHFVAQFLGQNSGGFALTNPRIVKNGVTTALSFADSDLSGDFGAYVLHVPPTLTDVNGSITATGTAFTILADSAGAIASSFMQLLELTNVSPPTTASQSLGNGTGTTAYSIAATTPAGGATLISARKRFIGGLAGSNPFTFSGTGWVADGDQSTTTAEYRVGAAHRVGAGTANLVITTATAGDQDKVAILTLQGA